ncbi:SAFB-like transcription modulator [Bactrocera neohumeralis]|uniref:SAFB-like transcription modulator n=1 Tax=Bactrocera neohumeralis TaxID=98809 RepID=UPI0021662B44|nr:SAFB-like transcription modulator [Bactrocera neohumeralis]
MVHDNEQMPNTEKMLRLRFCLKGEAARVIQHFQISSKNYEAAWSLLKKKYDNQPILLIIPKLSTTATKLTNAMQNIEDEKLITVQSLPLSSVEKKTTEIIEEDKKENKFEEEFFAELHEASITEEKPTELVPWHLSLPAGSHFQEMWESAIQDKSIEDEDEAKEIDHILEDDAKAQKEDNEIVQIEEMNSVKTLGLQWEPKREKSVDKKDKDISEQKSSSNKTSQKDDKVNTSTKLSSTGKQTTPSRNLWVSGSSSLTRASDLKTIFSKYGKVIGAKVVTNTRTSGTRCYGYVTMSSSSDTSCCIKHLQHTELHGRIISVERTKNEIGSSTSVAKTRVDTTKKDKDKKIQDTTSKTRDDKHKTIDSKKDDALKKPEFEKDKQRDKEKEKDHNKKDVNKTIEIAEIDPVGKAYVVTTIWELLIPWQLALTNETLITICGWKSLLSPGRMFKNEHGHSVRIVIILKNIQHIR